MTAPRGPQRSEDRSDLTPAAATHDTPYGASEARAEVEAFMGEGWRVSVSHLSTNDYRITAIRAGVSLMGIDSTYRAAVSALKQAWRDAVRPWVAKAAAEALYDDNAPTCSRVVSRVLGEDSNG